MKDLSVLICCANAADTLDAACRSVAWADELVIVDSGSTDATPEIARQYADRYVVEPWRGYSEQKKYGASLCRHDWVLVLDGDEEVSPALRGEVEALPADTLERYDVLSMPRRNFILGRHVRAWDPDWQSRLIHRGRCRWADEPLHDARLPSHPSRQGWLHHPLEHKRHSRAGFRDYFNGSLEDARALLIARHAVARGKRCHAWDLLLRPLLAFLKFYFIKRGFLDGQFGLLIAWKAVIGTVIKYAAIWAVQNDLAEPDPALATRSNQAESDRSG